MLRKLLKYDFKAVIKLWCLGALAVLVLSLGGGLCQRILNSDRQLNIAIMAVAGLGNLASSFALSAFSTLTFILVAIRFYKNLFSDEGYLTFTLPVKLHKIINSKLIMIMAMTTLTALWLGICYFLKWAIGIKDFFEYAKTILDGLGLTVEMLKQQHWMGWIIFYITEAVLIIFLSSLFGQLFLCCCITFGSVVAKKAKVFASIAIYYVSNMIFSIVIAIFMIFGIIAFTIWIDSANLTEAQIKPLISLVLFGVVALQAMLCSLLYTLQYRLLDRKLNLP